MLEPAKNVLEIFSKNGLWNEGVELIGSWCFLLYQKHFGAKPYPLRTNDIDFLISIPYRGKKVFDVGHALEELGFKPGFNSDGSVYYWSTDLKVEFLAPERGKGLERALSVKALSLKATPLRFMDMLFQNSVTVREDGLSIRIPSPLSFCLHKLIIARRRKRPDKKQKDIEQAVYTLPAVNTQEFKESFQAMPKKWRGSVEKSLAEAVQMMPLEKGLIEAYQKLL